jgi:hypothetical protein
MNSIDLDGGRFNKSGLKGLKDQFRSSRAFKPKEPERHLSILHQKEKTNSKDIKEIILNVFKGFTIVVEDECVRT